MGNKAYSLDPTYNLKPSWRGRHAMRQSVTQVRDCVWAEGERMSDDSNWSSLGESETMMNWSQTRRKTSSGQRLNVSMSLEAHTPYDDALALEQYQPAWEMLVLHERTCNIASSSSVSVGFEMARRPSEDERRWHPGMKRYGCNVIRMGWGMFTERSYWLARIPERDLGILYTWE